METLHMEGHTSECAIAEPAQERRVTARLVLAAGALWVALAQANPAHAADDLVQITFHGCSAAEQIAVQTAVTDADHALALARADLLARLPAPTVERAAQMYFGRSTPLATIADGFGHIAARLDGKASPIAVHCHSSEPRMFGWVPLEDCGTAKAAELHLGKSFFDAAAYVGIDSRMGTIIHEVAHLAPGLGANCEAGLTERYREDEVLMLGRLHPGYALENAQNYEYYVEALYGH
ncbi:MAG: hypothetical protein R3F55_09395 [Alphaproteobacteria bacterium]